MTNGYTAQVWEAAGSLGVDRGRPVREAYHTMLEAYEEAGIPHELSALFLSKQVRDTLRLYGVLLDTLTMASNALTLTVDISNGERTDPVTLTQSLLEQKAGLAVLHDEIARLAPFAGIAEGWDREITARARQAAIVERDGFLASLGDGSGADEA